MKKVVMICDRCNREYNPPRWDEYVPYKITKMICPDEEEGELDLCPQCQAILRIWLDSDAKLPISKECETCKHKNKSCNAYPCIECYHSHANLWESKEEDEELRDMEVRR